MQLQDYPAFQREVYEKIMEKFTYEGNEPEEKARLRYLFHGQRESILVLAPRLVLPEDIFRELEMPEYKNFLTEFALWRRENPNPDRSLWLRYPEDLEVLNRIYEAPPAQIILWQLHLDSPHIKWGERQNWYLHGVKWVDNYVEELWDMGIGRE